MVQKAAGRLRFPTCTRPSNDWKSSLCQPGSIWVPLAPNPPLSHPPACPEPHIQAYIHRSKEQSIFALSLCSVIVYFFFGGGGGGGGGWGGYKPGPSPIQIYSKQLNEFCVNLL